MRENKRGAGEASREPPCPGLFMRGEKAGCGGAAPERNPLAPSFNLMNKERRAMYLVREVMDKEILDCDGFKGGKVDDLLLQLRDGEPPVVQAILTQHGALAQVLGDRAARWGAWLRARALGLGAEMAPIAIG